MQDWKALAENSIVLQYHSELNCSEEFSVAGRIKWNWNNSVKWLLSYKLHDLKIDFRISGRNTRFLVLYSVPTGSDANLNHYPIYMESSWVNRTVLEADK
jgi:hypothetical protein